MAAFGSHNKYGAKLYETPQSDLPNSGDNNPNMMSAITNTDKRSMTVINEEDLEESQLAIS